MSEEAPTRSLFASQIAEARVAANQPSVAGMAFLPAVDLAAILDEIERLLAPTVAALFVDPGGVYADIPGVEVWDEVRDARLYAGPWPVIAHPPCNRWVSYGAREKRGDDGGCFASALASVREYGGVLEHPAHSQAWRRFGLPFPAWQGWVSELDGDGYAIEVDQHAYGFPTRKVTWLYAVGIDLPDIVALGRSAKRGCETLWSTERSKTPPAFAHALIAMARSSSRSVVA